MIQGVSGVILFLLIGVLGAQGYSFAVFSCIMVTVLGVISLVNGVVLVKNTLKAKEIRISKKVKQFIWSALCVGYTGIIIWFQLFNFINI